MLVLGAHPSLNPLNFWGPLPRTEFDVLSISVKLLLVVHLVLFILLVHMILFLFHFLLLFLLVTSGLFKPQQMTQEAGRYLHTTYIDQEWIIQVIEG
jgi:hypothetical protein